MGRRKGEGTLSTLPDGRVRARLTLDGHKYDQTHPDLEAALEWLADVRRRHRDGSLSTDPRVRTVGQQLEAFLAGVEGTVSEKSFDDYRRRARDHLAGLSDKTLAGLTADDVRRHLLGTLRKPPWNLAPRTITLARTILRRALQQAVDDGVLSRNVAARVKPPRIERAPQRVLSRQEQATLLSDAEAKGDHLAALWAVALRIGARESELLGLTWDDVDLERGLLRIHRQLGKPEAGRPVWRQTKTASGVRVVHLPRSAVEALQRHRARQDGLRLRYGKGYYDFNLVFATRRGTAYTQRRINEDWKRAMRRAGITAHVTFHGARHSAASTYLAAGVPVTEVSAILGHASVSTTMQVYAHMVPRGRRQASDDIDRYLEEEDGGPPTTMTVAAPARMR